MNPGFGFENPGFALFDFAAEDDADWYDWVDFFSRTREADGRRKGLIEVLL